MGGWSDTPFSCFTYSHSLDYHCENPHLMNFAAYPTVDQQHRFIRAYLSESDPNLFLESDEIIQSVIHNVQREVQHFELCSHLLWGCWGIIQASQSTIDFDYIGYSLQRFSRFYDLSRLLLN